MFPLGVTVHGEGIKLWEKSEICKAVKIVKMLKMLRNSSAG